MTEQEKREKAIEEMAQLGSIVCKGCDCTKCGNCVHYNRAKIIYDQYILRKEEEVRKETIIEIAKWLNGKTPCDLIWLLLRRFGVEVEDND